MEQNIKIKDKLTIHFKSNWDNYLLIFGIAAYILFGLLSIDTTQKTPLEILGDGVVAFIVVYILKSWLSKKGIRAGFTSDLFLLKINTYGKKKEEISPYIDEVSPFCEWDNNRRLEIEQRQFLVKYGISLERYKKGEYGNRADIEEINKGFSKINVYKYTVTDITNAYDNSTNEKEIMSKSVSKYEKKQLAGDFVFGLANMFVFGYFTWVYNGFSWGAIITSSTIVGTGLFMGVIKYFSSYSFIAQDLRGKIENVISKIDEFIAARKKYPKLFDEKMAIVIEEKKVLSEEIAQEENQLLEIENGCYHLNNIGFKI